MIPACIYISFHRNNYCFQLGQLHGHLLGKSCTFGSLSQSIVKVYQFAFVYFPFGFKGAMWKLIVIVPDYSLSFYLTKNIV